MPHIPSAEAPMFKIPGTTFTGLAAPSRGSQENAVWRVTVDPGTPARVHQLTREEILIATAGSATASISGSVINVNAGDALIVPPFTDFSLANPHQTAFEAIAVLPVGARAMIEGGDPFVPPWSL
ncbi:MAG: cupin domain-containing protein [Xanthobacteraceae bacterium]